MLCKTLVLMVHYSTKEHFKGVCDMLLAELTLTIDTTMTPQNAERQWVNMAELLALLHVCVSVRKGSRIDGMLLRAISRPSIRAVSHCTGDH
jgi:hypothetical protein